MMTLPRRIIQIGIRWQLVFWYTTAFAVLLLLTGAVFYQYLERALEASIDTDLQLRAQQIAGGIVSKDGTVTVQNVTGGLPGFDSQMNASPAKPGDVNYGVLVRVLDARGRVLGETPAFSMVQVPTASVTRPLEGQPWQGTVLSTNDQEVRLYSRTLSEQGRKVAVIQVGESLSGLHTLLHALVGVLLVVGMLVLLICAAGSYWLAARSFAPIRRLAETARHIKADDLHQRVPVPQAHDELQYLALTLNDMLDSLDQAFSRQRRFVADASHELRTPVAVIRNKAGITLLGTPTLSEATSVLHEIRGETERLSHLISDLLTLARGDEGQALFECEQVQFDVLVETVVAITEVLATERGIHLEVQVREPITLQGDEARLIQVVMNLLENAIRYTHTGGKVYVMLEKLPSSVRLTVRDTGVGIAPEHLPHIFERFYRADPSRKQIEGNGSGLGLAIVEWIVLAHHGSVDVTSQVGQGSCFTITLPLASPSHSQTSTKP